jgi:hypothetical protein
MRGGVVMALQIRYVKRVCGKDVVFEDAYVQITHDGGDKYSRSIDMTVYDDANKSYIVDMKTYSFPADTSEGSANFIKQGYEYAKTQEEFADAVDC